MRILTVVGARPQFIKAAPVSIALRRHHEEILVHTGQHFDFGMSGIFFAELGIPEPDAHLEIRSGSQAEQTGRMLIALEKTLLDYQPDRVLTYGDTNSTLAGVLAAAKLQIPVDHIEAGLRSFNRAMPEEINRLVADQLSDLLFCPTEAAVQQLATEGRHDGVHCVGDVMVDALLANVQQAQLKSTLLSTLHLEEGHYILATLHRPSTVDHEDQLALVLEALSQVDVPILFPIHPRTKASLERFKLELPANVVGHEPLSYLDMLAAEKKALTILTDSGGVQKEAYLLRVPCVTARTETEWVETIASGWNRLACDTADNIVAALDAARTPPQTWEPLFGDGHAAERIVAQISAQ